MGILPSGKKNFFLYQVCCEFQEHLKKIFKGEVKSERHSQYLADIRQRNQLRYAGFGPIDDEEQVRWW